MSTDRCDDLVAEYLQELTRHVRDLPVLQRRELLRDLEAHIANERLDHPRAGETELLDMLERLGTPEAIAAAAYEEACMGQTAGQPAVVALAGASVFAGAAARFSGRAVVITAPRSIVSGLDIPVPSATDEDDAAASSQAAATGTPGAAETPAPARARAAEPDAPAGEASDSGPASAASPASAAGPAPSADPASSAHPAAAGGQASGESPVEPAPYTPPPPTPEAYVPPRPAPVIPPPADRVRGGSGPSGAAGGLVPSSGGSSGRLWGGRGPFPPGGPFRLRAMSVAGGSGWRDAGAPGAAAAPGAPGTPAGSGWQERAYAPGAAGVPGGSGRRAAGGAGGGGAPGGGGAQGGSGAWGGTGRQPFLGGTSFVGVHPVPVRKRSRSPWVAAIIAGGFGLFFAVVLACLGGAFLLQNSDSPPEAVTVPAPVVSVEPGGFGPEADPPLPTETVEAQDPTAGVLVIPTTPN